MLGPLGLQFPREVLRAQAEVKKAAQAAEKLSAPWRSGGLCLGFTGSKAGIFILFGVWDSLFLCKKDPFFFLW